MPDPGDATGNRQEIGVGRDWFLQRRYDSAVCYRSLQVTHTLCLGLPLCLWNSRSYSQTVYTGRPCQVLSHGYPNGHGRKALTSPVI